MVYKKIKLLCFFCLVLIFLSGCISKESKYNACIEECCQAHNCKSGTLNTPINEPDSMFERVKKLNDCDEKDTYCSRYDNDCKNICVEKYK
jgi:hypothetical protein